jgi:V/A-type H+-transporting ATPase subunit E
MKGIETGKDKVRKITEALRKETLEPAMNEAGDIVRQAREEADKIIQGAKKEAESLFQQGREKLDRERTIFQSALVQASKQIVQLIKQEFEEKIFNKELGKQIVQNLQNPRGLADLITVLVKSLEKEGLDADFSVYISAAIPARDVNALLAKEILEKLKEKSVLLSPMGGGIELKLHKENLILDLSDTAIKELISNYIRKDFRELFFASEGKIG